MQYSKIQCDKGLGSFYDTFLSTCLVSILQTNYYNFEIRLVFEYNAQGATKE